jgi:hypothetical protein
MAIITFPRAVPDSLTVVGMSFPPAPMIEVTPLRSGRRISKELGPTLWRGHWQSSRMRPDKAGQVRAWYDTLLSLEEFYGYDKLREYPLAYSTGWGGLMVGASPFSGSGVLTTVAGNNVEMTIGSLPIGFVLSPGDYLAFDYSTSLRALHRCSAGATASGAGSLTVEVRPHVRPGWAVAAPVMFYRPAARMIILPGTYQEDIAARIFTTISFDAIQSL